MIAAAAGVNDSYSHTRSLPLAIDVLVPRGDMRRWHAILVDGLRKRGHDVEIVPVRAAGPPLAARFVLGLERSLLRRRSLADRVPLAAAAARSRRPATLCIDLSGSPLDSEPTVTTMGLTFDGSPRPASALTALLSGRPSVIEAVLNGTSVVDSATPMIDVPFLVGRGMDDIFSRAVTLMLAVVGRLGRSGSPPMGHRPLPPGPQSGGVLRPYATSFLPRVAREAARRLIYHDAHWRIGYRFVDGPDVTSSFCLGEGWRVVPDDEDHFYADPFPVVHDGRHYIFAEAFDRRAGKASIAVIEAFHDRLPTEPRVVLEAGHHLSYPQVFARDGEFWMIPESSASGEVVLYRAQTFPHVWERHSVLIAGRELSDATLLDHQGWLYLFATERDGYGSTSDTMVVFFSESLIGPWSAHPQNPIVIDRAAARPGGAFVRSGNHILLPLQDGTGGYGRGLGLAELLKLDRETVAFGKPAKIATAGTWPYPDIHTLNRAGALEVIDGIANVPRRRVPFFGRRAP
jgi:hypothetical protein